MKARQAWSDDSVVEAISNASGISFEIPKELPLARKAKVPSERISEEEWIRQNRRTKQADADDTDINRIVARHGISAIAQSYEASIRRYGDVSNAPEYQEALNVMIAAQNAFMALPPKARKEFDNDPIKFLEFMDKGDEDEMVRLGVATRKHVVDASGNVQTSVEKVADAVAKEAAKAAGTS